MNVTPDVRILSNASDGDTTWSVEHPRIPLVGLNRGVTRYKSWALTKSALVE